MKFVILASIPSSKPKGIGTCPNITDGVSNGLGNLNDIKIDLLVAYFKKMFPLPDPIRNSSDTKHKL